MAPDVIALRRSFWYFWGAGRCCRSRPTFGSILECVAPVDFHTGIDVLVRLCRRVLRRGPAKGRGVRVPQSAEHVAESPGLRRPRLLARHVRSDKRLSTVGASFPLVAGGQCSRRARAAVAALRSRPAIPRGPTQCPVSLGHWALQNGPLAPAELSSLFELANSPVELLKGFT